MRFFFNSRTSRSFPQIVKAVNFVQRSRNEIKTINSISRDTVAMKECGKSKGRSTVHVLHECEGDSQCSFLVITELSFAFTLCHTTSYLANFVSEASWWDYLDQWPKNPSINGIKSTATDRFLARGEVGWLLLITIRESKITILVISQLLVCHSVPEITHLTHMVPFQEMTSKLCRPYIILHNYDS